MQQPPPQAAIPQPPPQVVLHRPPQVDAQPPPPQVALQLPPPVAMQLPPPVALQPPPPPVAMQLPPPVAMQPPPPQVEAQPPPPPVAMQPPPPQVGAQEPPGEFSFTAPPASLTATAHLGGYVGFPTAQPRYPDGSTELLRHELRLAELRDKEAERLEKAADRLVAKEIADRNYALERERLDAAERDRQECRARDERRDADTARHRSAMAETRREADDRTAALLEKGLTLKKEEVPGYCATDSDDENDCEERIRARVEKAKRSGKAAHRYASMGVMAVAEHSQATVEAYWATETDLLFRYCTAAYGNPLTDADRADYVKAITDELKHVSKTPYTATWVQKYHVMRCYDRRVLEYFRFRIATECGARARDVRATFDAAVEAQYVACYSYKGPYVDVAGAFATATKKPLPKGNSPLASSPPDGGAGTQKSGQASVRQPSQRSSSDGRARPQSRDASPATSTRARQDAGRSRLSVTAPAYQRPPPAYNAGRQQQQNRRTAA
jgi:hypothetical protein